MKIRLVSTQLWWQHPYDTLRTDDQVKQSPPVRSTRPIRRDTIAALTAQLTIVGEFPVQDGGVSHAAER